MTTYYFAHQILDYISGRIRELSGGNAFVGLSYTKPTRDSTNVNEPAANTGYERVLLGSYNQSLTFKMKAPVDAETTNKDEIHFNEALIDYPQPVTHYLIYVGNHLVMYGELTEPIQPIENSVPMVRKEELKLTIDIE